MLSIFNNHISTDKKFQLPSVAFATQGGGINKKSEQLFTYLLVGMSGLKILPT